MIAIRNTRIGSGMPKICVPITGKTEEAIIMQAENISKYDIDIVEWRLDYVDFVDDYETIRVVLEKLRNILGEKLLLFTFRSAQEGGEKEIAKQDYFALNCFAAETGLVDLVDIELFSANEEFCDYIGKIQEKGCKVILSSHEFGMTPDEEEIIKRLLRMEELGADILKMAVMPKKPIDVVTLLGATCKVKEMVKHPVVTMSMAKLGAVSRLTGEVFGSAITFGTVGEASAPGQVPVEELKQYLEFFH